MKRLAFLFLTTAFPVLYATTYEVGTSQRYKTLSSVPWYRLGAGDSVNIYYQPACYAEKFLISTQGASWSNPITVQGVIDPASGNRPCVTGLNAVQARTSHDRWSGTAAQYSESLYVVGISLSDNASNGPAYIVLKNLEITGAAEGASYTADDGSTQAYGAGVAGIRLVNANHVRIQNCYVHGITGNGIFGKPNAYYPGSMADVQLLNNRIGGNGKAGNYLYHNSYIEADQSLYQANLYESLVPGGLGSDLKDRSAGTVVAYNRFSGSAARLIDLVEPQDGWFIFGSRLYYGSDFVYGNTFCIHSTDANFGAVGTLIHYGGDQGAMQYYRGQTLSFYDNTLVFVANQNEAWKHSIFQPELSTATVNVRNNIFLFVPRTTGGGIPELDWSGNNNGPATGKFQFGVNWVSPGWSMAFTAGTPFTGTSSGTSSLISPADNSSPLAGAAAGDLTLPAGSGAIGVAARLSALVSQNPQGGDYTPALQYQPEQQTVARANLDDLGAFGAAACGTPVLPPVLPPVIPKTVSIQQGVDNYTSALGTAISDLYASYIWNGGHGVTFPDTGVLYLKNSDFQIRPLLAWPNLNIPDLTKVLSAKLSLTITSWVNPGPIVGYYLNQQWDTSVDWSYRTSSTKWAAPGASADGMDRIAAVSFAIPQINDSGAQTIVVDLDPSVVNGWIHNPTSNNGIILLNTTNNGGLAYISSHTAATASARPTLAITYQ